MTNNHKIQLRAAEIARREALAEKVRLRRQLVQSLLRLATVQQKTREHREFLAGIRLTRSLSHDLHSRRVVIPFLR